MKRKLFSFALALALCLGLIAPAALAAGVEERFPAIKTYTGYADITDENQWFVPYVRVCTETGMLSGQTNGFAPAEGLTIAQAAMIAARFQDILNGGDGNLNTPGTWYAGVVSTMRSMAQAAGDLRLLSRLNEPDSAATRADFFGLIALTVPEDLLAPINDVTELPDSSDPDVLAFYRAGILSGTNGYGSFSGSLAIPRREAATMIARIIRPELRVKNIVLTPVPELCWAAGVLPETVFFKNSTTSVSALDYLARVNTIINELEADCVLAQMEFNWNNTVEVTGAAGGVTKVSFKNYVLSTAMELLGVTENMATEAYQNFDLQSFYSEYLHLTAQSIA